MAKKILETQRLILEELDEERFDDFAKLLANPIVHKFFPKTYNRLESYEYLQRVQNKQREDGISFWAVIKKDDQQFIGICGLLKQHIDAVDEVEVGYRIDNSYWGQGYGTEAAAGCMKYAKETLGLESVISLILPENKQSIRVAEKNGLTWEKETMFYDKMHQVYRIYLDDF